MRAHHVIRALPLLVVALALTACNLPFGGGGGVTPTPTLITPAVIPEITDITPSPTPTPEITATPTPTPTPIVTPTLTPSGPSTHQVARGEWVYAIARRYGINPRDLIAANPAIQRNPNLIYPNQQLTLPGGGPGGVPVVPPTAGAPSLPLVSRSTYEAMLAESLAPLQAESCSTPTDESLRNAWGQANVAPRLGCATAAVMPITGTWMEFGPGSRIIWLKELGEFHAITGSGYGQRWVFPDNSGLQNAAPIVGPGANRAYTPTQGRMAWLLQTYPEIRNVFSSAFGDENVIQGKVQEFENGAILFDGALTFVFFDDAGPWWYLPPTQSSS